MERRQKRLMAAGKIDQWAHLAARPDVVAVEAVSRAAILAEWTGARIHVLHISSADELRPLREAKARGVDITGETCPHYLMLSTDDYKRVPGVIAVNPPVREAVNQEPIWAALLDGTIDLIATDHAPHAPEEKTRNDIWTVDCGFPGVETQMPLMLTEVNAGRMSICDYVRMSAFNPARIWGLYPRKGALSPAPTPTSPSSISPAPTPSRTPSCSRARKSRRGTAARSRACRSTRWCADASS